MKKRWIYLALAFPLVLAGGWLMLDRVRGSAASPGDGVASPEGRVITSWSSAADTRGRVVATQGSVDPLHPRIAIAIRSVSLAAVPAEEGRKEGKGQKEEIGQKGGLRLQLRIGLAGPRPPWWNNEGLSLTGFRVTDKRGKQTAIRRYYQGVSSPAGADREEVEIDYMLPPVVAGKEVALLTCKVVRSGSGGADIPLARISVR